MKDYSHKNIEKKWSEYWEMRKLYATPDDVTPENKKYILPQLPYPSGAGLHAGHAEVYTACDIYSRYQRMIGKKVLQVIGWDAFGLPAENYAIKTNVHPRINTDKAIDTFRAQIKALGASVDWDREVGSHNSDYYKWTQWFFLLMYERGLAYRKKQAVNWCDGCKTVLANEQVVNGNCERCDTEIVQKDMEQWFLKITDYADRLSADLDKIDWPEETIKRQRDWIGKSGGAMVRFGLVRSSELETGNSELEIRNSEFGDLEIFTTRPDTIFGATFMVIAPEHEFVKEILLNAKNKEQIEEYVQKSKLKTELDRQQQKDKTGIMVEGISAVNPVNNKEIPLFIADYVLAGYGTGAIMGVPAHDERDFEFALKNKVSIIPVVANNDKYIGLVKEKWSSNYAEFRKDLDSIKPEILNEKSDQVLFSISKNHLEKFFEIAKKNTKNDSWHDLVGNEFYLIRNSGEVKKISKFEDNQALWTAMTNDEESIRKYNGIWEMLYHSVYKDYVCYSGEGKMINSEFLNGLNKKDAIEKILKWIEEKRIGERKIIFKLRDWSVSRQRFWGAPLPMIKNEELKINEYLQLPEKVIQLHAWGSKKNEHFHQWLKDELSKIGVESTVPDLPEPNTPTFDVWLDIAMNEIKPGLENQILIGRSLSTWTALKVAEQVKLRKLILLCPVSTVPAYMQGIKKIISENDVLESIEKFVGENDIDFQKVTENCGEIVVFLSTNDPYIPFIDTEKWIRKKLPSARIIRVRDAGHFDEKNGYGTFPHLKEEVLKEVRPDLKKVDLSDLPVILPDDVDFKPTGQSPLTYSPHFQDGILEKYGEGWKREVDTLDTFMCSSWYYYRYLDPHNDQEFASSDALKKWMPVDFYLGGAEHVNGHLLYSRFFTKVLFDAGYIDFDEPFLVHRHQGMILGEDNRKMSKRWGNVINPTDVIEKYGADTMRIYEMFMGPLEQSKSWSDSAVKGVRRFLDRIYDYSLNPNYSNDPEAGKIELHRMLAKVTNDTEKLHFNTAISKFMKFLNFVDRTPIGQSVWELFIVILSPYAPFLTEEIWQEIFSKKDSVHEQVWPKFDETLLNKSEVCIGVQINGKVRGTVNISKTASEDEAIKSAKEQKNVQKYLEEASIKKVIYVPGKILNIILD